jgi:PQQ-dependent catabolism-associated CXXCW motif protein
VIARLCPLATAAVLAVAGAMAHAADVAEPPGLWTGEMVSDTPATLQGAQVVDVAALDRLLAAPRKPLLVDVGPAEQRPEGLPANTLWRPSHRSLPGAVWFPGGGRADLPEARVQTLLQRVATLTGGDQAAPIVTFCKPRCWGSWNVGKRLVQAGYTAVHWFPAGVHGWQEQHETTGIEADPTWVATGP